jgi:hypothetical protein
MNVTASRVLPIPVVVLTGLAASGCAFGHHHAYHLGSPAVARGSSAVALAVGDNRESVLTGGNPTFVGLSRAGFGNSFPVYTASGRPLAEDLATSIRRGLEAAGYRVTPVRLPARAREQTVVAALTRTGAERLLYFEIAVWESDTLMRTKLDYDVTLRVFDAQGRELGRANTEGTDVLSSESAVETIYVRKLERLLNDHAIKRALAPAAAPDPDDDE